LICLIKKLDIRNTIERIAESTISMTFAAKFKLFIATQL